MINYNKVNILFSLVTVTIIFTLFNFLIFLSTSFYRPTIMMRILHLHPRSSAIVLMRMLQHHTPLNQCLATIHPWCKRHLVEFPHQSIHYLPIRVNSSCRAGPPSSNFSITCSSTAQFNRQSSVNSNRSLQCTNSNRSVGKFNGSSHKMYQFRTIASSSGRCCLQTAQKQQHKHFSTSAFHCHMGQYHHGVRRKGTSTVVSPSSNSEASEAVLQDRKKILFFGTDYFSLTCLRGLYQDK